MALVDDRHVRALEALNRVLVMLRHLAGQERCSRKMYDILDQAELLPLLLLDGDEGHERFEEMLVGLADSYPDDYGWVLETYSRRPDPGIATGGVDDPMQLVMPSGDLDGTDSVAFADHLVAAVCRASPAWLEGGRFDYSDKSQDVRFTITARPSQRVLEEAMCPLLYYRALLGRFAHHYLFGQLYEGFARRWVVLDGTTYRCVFYLANSSETSFWLRVFANPEPPRSEASLCE